MQLFNPRKESCSSIEWLLSEYLDGRLSAGAETRVEVHLDRCECCRAGLASLRATVGLLKQLPECAPRRSFSLAAPRSQARWHLYPVMRAVTTTVLAFFLIVFSLDVGGVVRGPVSEFTQESTESEPGPVNSEDGPIVRSTPGSDDLTDEEPDSSAGPDEDGSDEAQIMANDTQAASGWFPTLEYGLLGLLVVIGGLTLSQRRQWKRYGCG